MVYSYPLVALGLIAVRHTFAFPTSGRVGRGLNSGDIETSPVQRRDPQFGGALQIGPGLSCGGSWDNFRCASGSGDFHWPQPVPLPVPQPEPQSAPAPVPAAAPEPAFVAPEAIPQPQILPIPQPDSSLTQTDPEEYANGGGWAPAIVPPAPNAVKIASRTGPDGDGMEVNNTEQSEQGQEAPGLAVTTTTDVVNCRKFPDTLSGATSPVQTFQSTKINVNCWTTASLEGPRGRVQNSALWLRTSTGCYVNEMNIVDSSDFQAKLPYCVAPPHWIATTVSRVAPQTCYQCPSIKCPNMSVGTGLHVDVQCVVDGEGLPSGNNTWIKPIDQNCFLPADLLNKNGWIGTSRGKC